MIIIEGDLIKLAQQGRFDAIVHGCNCFCCMGAGVAFQIQKYFPKAYLADQATIRGHKAKLGTCQFVEVSDTLTVVNAYTQYGTGIGKQVNYDALRFCMQQIKKTLGGKHIGMPLIGCGLAGGDWDVVSEIIQEELDFEDVTIVVLDLAILKKEVSNELEYRRKLLW